MNIWETLSTESDYNRWFNHHISNWNNIQQNGKNIFDKFYEQVKQHDGKLLNMILFREMWEFQRI